MSFLEKIFRRKKPVQRVRICVECGMPVPEHKDWCAIFRDSQAASQAAQNQ
jgi:hypothetical protein